MSTSAPNPAESRNQPESSPMSEADLTNAAWWAWFWGEIEHWAFLLVVIFLAVEFAALKFAVPYKEKLDKAREAQVAALGSEAEAARAEIAKANASAAAANEQAARIEHAARWRRITPEQHERLAADLAAGDGGTITLSWSANDPEALFFGIQIEEAIQAANTRAGTVLWNIAIQPRIFSRFIFWGVRIAGTSQPMVNALRTAFSNAGIAYSTEAIPNIINDSPGMTITGDGLPAGMIWIGPKPLQN